MKKILVILVALAVATPSFAALIGESGTSIGGASFQPSTLVLIDVKATDSHYAAGSKHRNGSKCYAATDADATISALNGTVGYDLTDGMATDEAVLPTACAEAAPQ